MPWSPDGDSSHGGCRGPTDPPDLDAPPCYLDRELSWLDFNGRVLALAEDESVPLLERVKFLAIFSRNLDEFFMIRVAGLLDRAAAGLGAAATASSMSSMATGSPAASALTNTPEVIRRAGASSTRTVSRPLASSSRARRSMLARPA